MGQVQWIISRGISMRDAADEAGFKIEKLGDFGRDTQKEFKRKVVNSIIADLDYDWEDQVESYGLTSLSSSLSQVENGIYVLCLDGGLCVHYDRGNSRVVYIGKGNIRKRIKSHLDRKLLGFFLQIPGIKFRFYMTEPKKTGPGGHEYFHDFEHDLLKAFSERYAGWPMFNKNAGRQHSHQHEHKASWKLPLNNVKANYVWSLSPVTVKETPKLQDL
jgi:hypothetical protein